MLNARRHLARVLSLDSPSLVRRCIHTSAPFLMPIVVISPAKALDETPLSPSVPRTEPRLTTHTAELIKTCKRLTAPKIKSLMGVSDAIASLNAERFARWDEAAPKQCAFAFDGPAFRAFDAASLSADELAHAQTHVRFLSGLYGLLRPFDAVKPYRLEMGSRLETARGSNLYAFWGDAVTAAILEDLESQPQSQRFVVNCASQEYWKCVNVDLLAERGVDVYTCVFPGPSVYAKAARGAMCRHVAETRATDPSWASTANGVSRMPRRTVKPWSSKDRTPVRNRRRVRRRAEAKEAKEGGDGIRNRNQREPRSAPARRRRRRTRTDPRRARDAPRRRRRDRSHVKAWRITFRHASVRISSRHLSNRYDATRPSSPAAANASATATTARVAPSLALSA